MYQLMSVIYHSKKHKLLRALVGKYGKSIVISMDYSWDEEGMTMASNLTLLHLAFLHHTLLSIFHEDFSNYKKLKERINRVNKVDKALLGIVESNPKKSFSQLASNLRKIGRIIKTADKGEDWQRIARQNS